MPRTIHNLRVIQLAPLVKPEAVTLMWNQAFSVTAGAWMYTAFR